MFFYNFDKVGKGIHPGQPKKTGFAWFCDIIGREIWTMLYLNLLFLLFSIPLFTIGAATSAMNTLLIRMVKDKPVDAFPDFRRAFRENFSQATGVFFIQAGGFFLLVMNLLFYGSMNAMLETVIWAVLALFLLGNLAVYPVMASVELKIPHIFKNSLLLFFLNGKYALLSAVICVVLGGLSLWFFPVSILFLGSFGIVLMHFINCFLSFYGIEKYCYPQEPLTAEQELALLSEEEAKLKEELGISSSENTD